jgi:hypothetical protein
VLPFVIFTLYWIKIRHRRPLPDLKNEMTLEDVEYIYKSVDIEQIRIRAYTESKHEKFLRTYGILVENINLAEMGKAKTILIGLLSFVRQIILSFIVVYLNEKPVIFILGCNLTGMLMIVIQIH